MLPLRMTRATCPHFGRLVQLKQAAMFAGLIFQSSRRGAALHIDYRLIWRDRFRHSVIAFLPGSQTKLHSSVPALCFLYYLFSHYTF